jgi:MFS family permease
VSSDGSTSIFHLKNQAPIYLIGLGHGATHWIAGTFYILLPSLTEDLGLTYTEAGLLVSIFHASSFAANFGSGVVVDVTGRKVIFQILSLVVGAAALAVFGVTALYYVLALMVMLIGATNNLWHPPAIAFISERYPENRGYALSIHATGASVGDMIAPAAVGVLLVSFSWQSTAAISTLPVLLVVAVFVFYLMPMDRPAPGVARKTMAFGDYLSGIAQLVRRRAVLGLCLMAAFRSMAQVGLLMFLPLYLADVLKVDPWLMGLTISAMHFGGVIVSPIAGIWSDKVGRRPIVMAGLSATTVLILILPFIPTATAFVAAVSVLGFVLYAVRPVIHSWMMDLAPPEVSASATSLLFGTQAALSVLMPLVGGKVADHYGLVEVFYVIAAVMLVANLMVVLLPGLEKR